MPTQSYARTLAVPVTIELAADEAAALGDAIKLAVDHYTRKAEERRRLSERAMTISQRRQAFHDATDLTAHARKLDALRARLAPR